MIEDRKGKIIQIILSIILLTIVFVIDKLFSLNLILKMILYLIPYFCCSFDVYCETFKDLKDGEIFGESFLMCVATIMAFVIGFFPEAEPELLEAVLVMLFFQVGEFFEIIAEEDSENSLNKLLEIRPDYANIKSEDGKIIKVDPKNVRLFETIVVNPGEKIPMDGNVLNGSSTLNTSSLTGESIPTLVSVGDYVMSGCINLTSQIEIRVMKTFDESTASKIIDMVENSNNNKAEADKFITRFSRIYTPFVLFLALLVFLIPPLFVGEPIIWLKRSLTFLVVSCPCALVISIPLAYFGGIGCSAKKGILIKGSNYLDMLSNVKTIAFDKTGTLTKGTFEVVAVHPKKLNEKELLHLAAHAEKYSTHPIANSLKQAYDNYANLDDNCTITDIEEIPGIGIKAKVNGSFVYVGDEKLMSEINIPIELCESKGKIIHVASKKEYLGHIVISDKIRENAKEIILKLDKIGINSILVSGDSKSVTKNVANKLNVKDFYYELLPKDKVKVISDISKKLNKMVAFVGDGVNDAPVLARSDVGIAMGGLGSDAAIESSNIVLMDDNLSKIIEAIEISKKTDIIVKENIIFSLFVKFSVLLLAFLGFAPMFLAVFADVGVTIIAILNSLRTLRM